MSKKFSYEQAIEEVEQIINNIENGEINIDKLSENVSKATKLLNQCKVKLTSTKKDLDDLIDNKVD